MYESVWARYLGLFVGHSAYAQTIVLVVFLGGLSAGSLLAAQRSEKVRSPLLWYAAAELGVGILGFFFHDAFVLVLDLAREQLFPLLVGSPLLIVVQWLLAGSLILPPAILLGTTFPFMSAGVLRASPDRPGRTLGLLYFANSLGAAAGALVAGFILVAWVGLPGTLLAAAVINVVVALVTYLVGRRLEDSVPEEARPYEATPEAGSTDDGSDLWRFLLAVSFGTAVASFIYEIAWIRMLSLVLGSATHSFELMLSAFIAGLAFGALYIQWRADSLTRPLRTLAIIQWLMGFAALATLPLYLELFGATAEFLRALDTTDAGYRIYNLGRYGMALAVMVPSTFCAGMTLPLITKMLVVGPRGEKAIGWVYGINTLGSIVGVALASLLLLPLIGLKALLISGAVLDMMIGVALLARAATSTDRGWITPRIALAATALVTVSLALVTPFDRSVLNSGVFRTGRASQEGEIVFWEDGRTASVGVLTNATSTVIATNGKPDASVSIEWMQGFTADTLRPFGLDESTQTLFAMVALAHVPQAQSAAVIGHGSGMSSHMILGSPTLEEVVTVEIEPAMIEGSRLFLPANRRVFEDPRSEFIIEDAKSYFASSQKSFDIILSEPSNPWVSGVSSLFTEEFYALVSRHLNPGGVFGQWMHLYEMDDLLVLGVFAALHRNFASYEVFQFQWGDIYITASNEPDLPTPDWGVFDLDDIKEDLRGIRALGPEYMARSRFLTRRSLAPLLDDWGVANSDYYPVLDLGAERARYLGEAAVGFNGTTGTAFDPTDVFLPRLTTLGLPGAPPMPGIPAFAASHQTQRYRAYLETGDTVAAFAGDDGQLRSALYDDQLLEALAAEDAAPVDWERWLGMVYAASARRHGGLRGWSDDAFYDEVGAFAHERLAPAPILAVLRFEQGLRAWDWPTVADAALELQAVDEGQGALLDPDLLRDAGVMALLLEGRTEAARELYDALAPKVTRSASDLRSRLLRAYLERSEAGGVL